MNIFAVHENAELAAQHLCDKHVVKMIVEGCQMLSTIHRAHFSQMLYFDDKMCLYKSCFEKHPCTIWAASTSANYMWLARHTYALCNEYTNRYNKIHKCDDMAFWFSMNYPHGIVQGYLTPFAQAMPDKYKHEDGVTAYRNYYIHEKSRFAKWKYTNPPFWYERGLMNVSMQVLQ